jgi:hypothetical protein
MGAADPGKATRDGPGFASAGLAAMTDTAKPTDPVIAHKRAPFMTCLLHAPSRGEFVVQAGYWSGH